MPKIDPQKAFITGEAFLEVGKVMLDALKAGNRNILALAFATNCAIALEIYLKCLLILEIGHPCSGAGHDVYKLFKNLSLETQSELAAEHDKFLANNPDFVKKWKEKDTGVSMDLESLLKAGRHAFIKFRYAYEKIPKDTVWGLNGFIKCVRARILSSHPEWEAAFHGTQSTFLDP